MPVARRRPSRCTHLFPLPSTTLARHAPTHLAHEAHDILHGAALQEAKAAQLPGRDEADGAGARRRGVEVQRVDLPARARRESARWRPRDGGGNGHGVRGG
jgi:hypothetical protein